ncbi:hypothetical protein BsWGS_00950 [Bradybaena similaris]
MLFCAFYRLRKRQMSVFKTMGIPGPEPNFLFGNLLAFKDTPVFKKHKEWRDVYGETFGYYEGPTPVLVTSDVHVLQEVFIKQFNKFHARKLWPVQVDPDKDEDVHMFFARGRRWKRLRLVVNPAFSAAKIRKMAPTVNECINHLLDVIRDAANEAKDRTIELMELFRRLTLDTILRCEVGLDQNSVKNPEDPFLTHCKGVIDDTTKMPWLYLLGFIFPDLHCVWIAIYKLLHYIKFNPVFWLEARMRQVVVMRRNTTQERGVDLMQQMLDAQFPADSVLQLEHEELKLGPSHTRTLRSMTNEEIVSHALLFLLAGYETTSTTLSYIFFELSQNAQVQQRLRHEVMTVLPRGYHTIHYDDLKKLTYLDYVIWETLRKYPLASTVTARKCMQDCQVGGLRIPAGMLVHANLWDVHFQPKHWGHDPHKFDPLRFMPERRRTRHPCAWMPFGSGPRSCAGLRFALLQLKMVVAKVLRDFDFQPSGCQTLALKEGATILPADGVRLATRRRSSALSEAGLRRGSIMTGVPLSEWTSMRRSSMTIDDSAEDIFTDDENSGETNLTASRRESLAEMLDTRQPPLEVRGRQPRINRSRRNSVLEYELMDEGLDLMRRMSFNKGREIMALTSIDKGIKLLGKTSVPEDQNLLPGKGIDNCFKIKVSKMAIISREEEFDPKMGVPNMPEEILGAPPRLTSQHVLRRASAVPELQSVGEETATIENFAARGYIPGQTSDIMDEKCSKETMKFQGRLYQRRGSG